MTVQLSVSERTLKTATPLNARDCVLACALNRRLRPEFVASVSKSSWYVGRRRKDGKMGRTLAHGTLPFRAGQLVHHFDQGWKPHRDLTGRYRLPVPKEFLK